MKYKYRAMESVWRSVVHRLTLPSALTGKVARGFLASLVVASALAYAFQINTLSTSGYQIHALEKQMSGLQGEIQKLDTDIAAAQSLTSIQKRLAGTGLLLANSAPQLKSTGDIVVAQR